MTALAGTQVVVVNWRDPDHSLAGGAEIYAWHFACGLRDGGAAVTFLTAREKGQARREERDGVTVRRGGGTLGFYLFVLAWLLRKRRRVDAVIDPACGLPSFSPVVLRRRTPVLLVVHHVHQDQFAVHFPRPVAAFGTWMERVAMPRVYRRRLVAAVSESTAAEMRRRLAWTGDIQLLANGADLASYDARDAVAKDPTRVVVLGRLVTHKRVDLALEAVGRLGRSDVHVDVIGQGPEHDRLLARTAELGLADRVRFHGFLPGPVKDALLARASVHLCASDAEGWGQAVIDAAGSGVPTVARDVPGLRDSIRPGESGWLVPDDGDHGVVVARLSGALAKALEGAAVPAERVRRADACVSWAHTFDWSQMRENACDLTVHMLVGGATVSSDRHQPRVERVAV